MTSHSQSPHSKATSYVEFAAKPEGKTNTKNANATPAVPCVMRFQVQRRPCSSQASVGHRPELLISGSFGLKCKLLYYGGLYRDYIGIMEKKIETTTSYRAALPTIMIKTTKSSAILTTKMTARIEYRLQNTSPYYRDSKMVSLILGNPILQASLLQGRSGTLSVRSSGAFKNGPQYTLRP